MMKKLFIGIIGLALIFTCPPLLALLCGAVLYINYKQDKAVARFFKSIKHN